MGLLILYHSDLEKNLSLLFGGLQLQESSEAVAISLLWSLWNRVKKKRISVPVSSLFRSLEDVILESEFCFLYLMITL